MKPLWWMIGASLASWLAITTTVKGGINPELLLGMLGPLASAIATWILTVRTHASAPERLMGVMVMALAAKMVLFGAYVVVMLRVVGVRPVPFTVSFAAYFIALYLMEALFLRRLLVEDAASRVEQAPSRA